ncbi:MAG: alpha-glucosidase/alpha-galactosidase [Verrucomicrobiota bacterium]
MAKITLIGAGSVVFAKSLISDILQFPDLSASSICLMDINPDRLKVADVMARKIIAKLGVKATLSSTTDRREAIRDANYVICTIQVGGYKPGTVIDFEIPRKYGLKQTIADTLGIGGIFRSLRTIPEINKIAKDIADYGASNCLFLNYSNPMAMNCMAIDKEVGIPHVGLCHSVQGTSKVLAKYAGLPYEDVSFRVAGINHMAFFLEFEYKGQDAYPLLFKAMDDPQIYAQNKVRFEMMRRTGFFVTESSEHQAEYVPYFIHHGQDKIDEFDIPIDEYLRRCEAIIATWEETEKELLGNDGDIEVRPRTHEYGSFIINARETNHPTVVYGNVPNRDLITNLPNGCCVEVPCLVDKNGIQPTRIGDLPTQLAAICRSNINVQELTVEAALGKRRESIYHAAMMDPHTAASLPLDKIWAMCDDLIEAHQKEGFLGEFAPVVKNSGRAFAGIGDRVTAKLAPDGPFDPSKGSENKLILSVDNPNDEALEIAFQLDPADASIDLGSQTKIQFSAPANDTSSMSISYRNLEAFEQGFHLKLDTAAPNILCQGANVNIREVIEADESGCVPFELELDGNPAVEGSIQKSDTGLRIVAKVNDSLITQANRRMAGWTGSRFEFQVARNSHTPIASAFFLPSKNGEEARVVDINLKEFPSAQAKQTTTEMYYKLELDLSYESLGLNAEDKTFIFDVASGLGALGDAHSGGQTSLSNQFGSNRDSSQFLRAQFS